MAGSFAWATGDTSLSFRPAERLRQGSRYEAAIALTARPANGEGTLRRSASHRFLVVPAPAVVRSVPANGERAADPQGPVSINFAGPLDANSLGKDAVTVLPKPASMITGYNEYDGNVYLTFDKLPNTAYTVTVSGSIADPYGNKLGKDVVIRFTTRDYSPIVQFASQASHVTAYSAYTSTFAAVTNRNVDEVAFRLYRVPERDFITLTGVNYWDPWSRYQPSERDLVREWSERPRTPRNETGTLTTPLVQRDGRQLPTGMYYLSLWRREGQDSLAGKQLIVRTDLNLVLKVSENDALVWATDLKSGQPVSGVRIRLTDNKALNQESVTGADGVAAIKLAQPRQPYEPLLALANGPQGQFGVATNAWEQGIGSYDFGLGDGVASGPYVGYLYTDRPIYRPGQTMHWKAIVRREADARFTLPDPGQMVTVTIRDGQGTELWTQLRPLSPLGTLDGDFPLGVEAGLGYYTINLALNRQVSFGAGFQVAEYRKPEYELTVLPQKQEYGQGEEMQVQVQASYYSGGPVSRARVKWSVLASRYFFQWEPPASRAGRYYSFEDFDLEDGVQRPVAGGPLAGGEGVTDANGVYTFTVKADIARLQGDQRLTFDVTITDPNNQPVSGQGSAIVHKAPLYAGLSPQSYVAAQGEENIVDVVTVDWAGRPVANEELTIVANEATWYSVREQAEDGRYYWTSRLRKTPVYTATVTTDSRGEATFRWQAPRPGQFKIEATGRGGGTQAVRSATYVWVHGGSAVTWRQEDNNRMTLVAGKDEYRPGETAELVLANPFSGKVQALLTIERGTVLQHELMLIEGNSVVIRVPVRPEYAPDVYVSLIAVKGMDATNPLPSFRMGLARLNVPATDRKLQITITPDRKQAGPRDTVVGG